VQPLARLRNCKIGIVGLGRIGTATAIRARSLGLDVVFFDPYKQDGYDKALGIRRANTFEDLLGQVNILTLHCPLTTATHHLINEKTLQQMTQGSYLINTARGAIVDTSAIPNAVVSGRLAGAAFDVLAVEPPVDDVLVQAWRNPDHAAHHKVLINPHSAFYSEEGLMEIRVKGAKACVHALEGKDIRNLVN
jgi:D-3-phosphoglycerate dehydrogenase/C-terminal binding protein